MNLVNKYPWLDHYDSHVSKKLRYPWISVVDLLRNAKKKFPNKVCIIDEDYKINYEELDALSDQLAKGLIELGIKKGESVGIILPNCSEFVISFFATLKSGGVVVAINPFFQAREFIDVIQAAKVNRIICEEEFLPRILDIKNNCSIKTIIVCARSKLSAILKAKSTNQNISSILQQEQFVRFENLFLQESDKKLGLCQPGDPVIYQFTGGTTGNPKAVIGLHRNLVANAMQFMVWCNLKVGEETILAAIPLYHVYGMVLTLCLGVMAGARIVLIRDGRNSETVVTNLKKNNVSFFPAVPSMFYALIHQPAVQEKKYNLKSIKACISGSAPLLTKTKNDFELMTGAKIMEGYGLSEAPTATHCNPLIGENKTGSIGMPLPDVNCRIVDLESGKKDLEVGEYGE